MKYVIEKNRVKTFMYFNEVCKSNSSTNKTQNGSIKKVFDNYQLKDGESIYRCPRVTRRIKQKK